MSNWIAALFVYLAVGLMIIGIVPRPRRRLLNELNDIDILCASTWQRISFRVLLILIVLTVWPIMLRTLFAHRQSAIEQIRANTKAPDVKEVRQALAAVGAEKSEDEEN